MSDADHTHSCKPTRSDEVQQCVTAFASAVKNITIYPPNHPRVIERASDFSAKFAELAFAQVELVVGKEEFWLDDGAIPAEHLAVGWLLRHCRETGIGTIRIEARSHADDVIAFATALINCRARSGISLTDSWDDGTARVRPIALVIEERRLPDGARNRTGAPTRTRPGNGASQLQTGPQLQTGSQLETGPQLKTWDATASLPDKLSRIAALPSVRALTEAITQADTSDEQQNECVDLMAMIASVLPVDCPTDADGLQATIEHILERTLHQLQKATQQGSRVRSAHLLRSAIGVAKTYFARSNTGEPTTPEQPSGRPEDDAIQADRDALLAEMAMLPDATGLRLPLASELATDGAATTKGLLSICLHSLTSSANHKSNEGCTRTIAALLHKHASACAEVLASYLQPEGNSTSARLIVLRTLVDAGQGDVIREQGYLDEALLRAGFPEVLPIAARAFTLESELARIRQAMADLATVIENGGAAAAAATGLLDDIATVNLLANIGNPAALQLLTYCESNDPEVQRALLLCARNLELPECEHLVVHVCSGDDTPAYYLRRLLRAAAKNHFDAGMRSASGNLLREFLGHRHKDLPLEQLTKVIRSLRHVKGTETLDFLRELIRAGKLSLRPRQRALRQCAQQTLQVMQPGART